MRRLAKTALMGLAAGAAAAGDVVRTGPAAYGDWRSDAPGVRRLITPADLPPPYATASAANSSSLVRRPPDALPQAPPGFAVDLLASGLSGPRAIRAAPNGDLFVAESDAGRLLVLRADGTTPAPAAPNVFAADLPRVFGVAFFPPGPDPRWVYAATERSVVRFPYRSGGLAASGPAEVVVPDLPVGGAHWTRDLAFSPDGGTMFVSVGSATNDAEGLASSARRLLGLDTERDRADVLAFDPAGRDRRVFATGLRNCSGLTTEPASGALWCVVNERDGLGDDLPPDYATRVGEGAVYGWPWFYTSFTSEPENPSD